LTGDFETRFSVALERRGDHAVVRPTGDLESDTAPQLERALSAVQAPGRRVVLDLRGLRAADSTGLHTIVAALDRADRLGAELRVVPGDVARRLFDAAGLGDRLAAVEVAEPD
jgi:anti-sigma B factor antagonist